MGIFDMFKKKEQLEPDILSNPAMNPSFNFAEHSQGTEFMPEHDQSSFGSNMNMNNPYEQDMQGAMPQTMQSQGHMQNNPSFTPTVNLSNMGSSNFNNMQNTSMQSYPTGATAPDALQKDLQIISLKLDAIRSDLDNLNQRMKNIENNTVKEQPKRWY